MKLKKDGRDKFAAIWQTNQSCVDGDPFIQAYLYRHPVETDEDYNRRVAVSAYQNLSESILLRWKQIYGKAKTTIETPNDMDVIVADIDKKGNNIEAFSQLLFEQDAMLGGVFALIDLPEWNSEGQSEQARLDANVYPYVSLYTQPNVMNWEFDDYKNLTMIIVKTTKTIEYKEKDVPIYAHYTFGNRIEFYLDEKGKWVETSNVPIMFGKQLVMPFVVDGVSTYSQAPDYFKSPMTAINALCVELYNRQSASGNAYDQTDFQFIAAESGSIASQLGNKVIYEFPEGGNPPAWVSPDASNFEQTRKEINRIEGAVFTTAGMKNRAVLSDTAKSGEALKMEDSQSENKVQLIGNTVAEQLEKILKMLALANASTGEISVIPPESYAVDALADELERLAQIYELKNNTYYLIKFSEFIKRTVDDVGEQKKAIEEAERTTGLRLSALQSNDVIVTAIDNGTLSLLTLAREIEPSTKEMPDKEVENYIMDNANFAKQVKDKFGLVEVVEPANPTE